MPIDQTLEPFDVVHGSAQFEWLEGERFLLQRSRTDDPDFPDSLIVFGADGDGLSMDYFDSRGVRRIYQVSLRDGVWRMWRHSPGFSQKFNGRLSADGETIEGSGCSPATTRRGTTTSRLRSGADRTTARVIICRR